MKLRQISEDKDEPKVLLRIVDSQIDITKFCEEYAIKTGSDLNRHHNELLEYVNDYYLKIIDIVSEQPYGGAEGKPAEHDLNYDPEIKELKYRKIEKDRDGVVNLLDCDIIALVKFREYLHWLSSVANLDALADVSEDVIDNNGVNVHAIISDVYDQKVEDRDTEYREHPLSAALDEIIDITRPISRYQVSDLSAAKSSMSVRFTKISNEFEYMLYCRLHQNEYGAIQYTYTMRKMHPPDKEGCRSCPRTRRWPRSPCYCFEPLEYEFSLDDRDDALTTLDRLVKKFKLLP